MFLSEHERYCLLYTSVLEATAPNADKVTQLDFGNFEKFAAAPVPSELVDKLTARCV